MKLSRWLAVCFVLGIPLASLISFFSWVPLGKAGPRDMRQPVAELPDLAVTSLTLQPPNIPLPSTSVDLPELATEWSASEDGLIWTFKMRNDVHWVKLDPASGEFEDLEESAAKLAAILKEFWVGERIANFSEFDRR